MSANSGVSPRNIAILSSSRRSATAGGLALEAGTESMFFNPAGGSGQRIEGPTDTTLHTSAPIGSFSVSLWYKLDALLGQFSGPCGSSPSFALSSGWGIYRNTSDDTVNFYVGSFSGSAWASTVTGIWGDTTTWHHLVAVFDATNRQGTLYWDGTKSQSSTNQYSETRALGVQNQFGTLDRATSTDFTGKIDTVGFWNGKVINDAEAALLYNSGTPTVPHLAVAGATWSLRMGDDASDDATPTTGQVTDQTANGNDFTPEAVDNVPAMAFSTDAP